MTLLLLQTALAWTGGDAYYDMSSSDAADADAPPHGFVDISTTGTVLSIPSDHDDATAPLSEAVSGTFRFYGRDWPATEIYVDSNGRIAFGAPNSEPQTGSIHDVALDLLYAIHVIWADLNPCCGNSGTVYAQRVGDFVIVQWDRSEIFVSGGDITAQVRMNTRTGEIYISNGSIMLDNGGFTVFGQGLSTPSGGLQARDNVFPPVDVTYYFRPTWTCPGGDPALCDAVDLAAAATPMIDEASPNVRLRPSAIYARLDAIRTFGTGAGCGFSGESWGGGYARGLAEGTTTTGGVVTGMFRLNDVEGDVDGTPFGVAYGAYGRGNVLASDGADFVTGMYVRTKGPHGVWVMLEGDTCNGLAVYGPTL